MMDPVWHMVMILFAALVRKIRQGFVQKVQWITAQTLIGTEKSDAIFLIAKRQPELGMMRDLASQMLSTGAVDQESKRKRVIASTAR